MRNKLQVFLFAQRYFDRLVNFVLTELPRSVCSNDVGIGGRVLDYGFHLWLSILHLLLYLGMWGK